MLRGLARQCQSHMTREARLTRRDGRRICASMIYKLLLTPEWRALEADGSTAGAPLDLADGYVHFSTAAQVAETAARHFAGVEGLWLLAVEAAVVADNLRWEPSRGGDLFPHLHAPLRLDQVAWARPLPLVDGTHAFPDDLA